MAKRDFYQILGVEKGASEAEIKKAYRRLALRFHPDKNAGDANAEERFKEVTEAYEVLKDPKKRQMYDQFGVAGDAQGFRGANPFEGFGGFSGAAGAYGPRDNHDPLGDVFGDFFGDVFGQRRRGSPRRPRGADLRYTLTITLEEAYSGTEKMISFVRSRGGKEDPARLSVRVPAGVKSGQRLKLQGEGDQEDGGTPGDLYVIVNYADHPLFRRHNNDVQIKLPLSFLDAILGTEVEIPTLTGKAALKVPPGVQSGQLLRLKGKGFQEVGGYGRGDMLIKIMIDVPKVLSPEQKGLIEQLARTNMDLPLVKDYQSKVDQLWKSRS